MSGCTKGFTCYLDPCRYRFPEMSFSYNKLSVEPSTVGAFRGNMRGLTKRENSIIKIYIFDIK